MFQPMKMRGRRVSLPRMIMVLNALAAILLCPAAQAQDPRGALRGVAEDLHGGRVAGQGFAEVSAGVTAIVSSARDIIVTMRPTGLQQTMNVRGRASSIGGAVGGQSDVLSAPVESSNPAIASG